MASYEVTITRRPDSTNGHDVHLVTPGGGTWLCELDLNHDLGDVAEGELIDGWLATRGDTTAAGPSGLDAIANLISRITPEEVSS